MKLRLKSVIAVCVTVFMLLAIFSSVAYVVVLSSFSELEKEHVMENVQRAKNVLDGMIADLDRFLLDWSCWDDTYYFVMDNNTEYIEANLLDLTFINAELNAMIFINSSGQIVFGKAFDLYEQTAIPISQSLLSNIEDSGLLWNYSEITNHVSGLLLLQEGPMLIASRPVTMSSGEGPIAGALIMGRNLDDAKIQELTQKTALTLNVQRLDDPQLQLSFQSMRSDSADSEQILVKPQNSDTILGYTLLSDVYGNPILVLKVDMPRNIYKQGLASLYYIVYSIVVGGLVFLGVFLILLEKLILARIEKISNITKEIRKSHNLSLRAPETGNDELSDFSREFNQMLSTVDTLEHKLRNYSEHLEELVEQRTEELKKNQEKLKSILSASPDAITATDLNGIITECNEQTLRMHEYASKEELIGKSAFDLIAPKDHEKAEEKIKETLEKGYVKNVEYTFLTKNGREFPAELSASVIRDQNRKPIGFVAITKDISERKTLEQQLFKAQKLAAIGELAGMVGHDLRNPLTGIQGAVYYLKTKYYNKLDSRAKEMITIIQDAINRSNKIINDLLEYAKEIHLDVNNTNLDVLIKESLSSMEIPDSIKVECEGCEAIELRIDIAKMQRVLINIIKNAIEAMPDGGKLSIHCSCLEDYVTISVSDTGVGIPKENLEKIWAPLFTTKAKGMGFGLPICKRIVEAHGGIITVESMVGKGTTFTITIPQKIENQQIVYADAPNSTVQA